MGWTLRADLTGPPGADGSDADVTAHEAETDPHPQYMTSAETAAAYQPLDSDLTTIAGLTATTDSFLQSKSSAWTTRTPAQVKTDLSLTKGDVGLGNVDNTADTAKPVSSAQQSALDLKAPLASPAFTGTPTGITKSHVGLGNVDNTADSAKPVSTAQQTALDGKQPLDSDLTTIAGLTATTDSILQSKASAWTVRTPAQFKTDLALAKGDVGLGNVDNTSDVNKPVSTAQQTALDGKQPLDSDLTTIAGLTATTDSFLQSKASAWTTRTPAQVKTDLALAKGDVGLGNVDNTSDVNKPVSTAQQTALDGKQPLDSDLTTIAGLTATTDSFLQSKSSAWTTRTPAQVKTDLAIVAGDITSGTFGIGRIPTGTTSSTVAIGNDTRLSVKPYPPVTLTDQATVTTDASLGTHFRLTGTTARTIAAPTNATDGQVITYEIKASSGALTHTWNAIFTFGSDLTALSAVAAGKTDFIQFIYSSAVTKWLLIGYVKGYTT